MLRPGRKRRDDCYAAHKSDELSSSHARTPLPAALVDAHRLLLNPAVAGFEPGLVLCLSASTSFVGLPRLCHVVAQDDFLPRPFATFGRRLVSSVGIVYLALTARLPLTVFDGITDRLIPLFAIGAFLTFSMSQTGMAVHWRRELRDKHHAAERRRVWFNLVINTIGASTTVTALAVIVVAEFAQGGWTRSSPFLA